jgi:ectoine hydroxylase-related dioxygenase (phytanoyl-CoA dioxygenase family)
VSIHDSHLIHGSGVNRSGRRRAAYTIRYLDPKRAWVDVSSHPIPVFLVRGDAGAQGGGYIEARPGEVAPGLFGSVEDYRAFTTRHSMR